MKKQIIPPGSVIGIIGGGQLGRMAALEAAKLGYRTHIFTPEKASPAEQVSHRVTIAPYRDREALRDFAQNVDVVTFEFENIPFETLKMLEGEVLVRPGANALHISQNRIREKDYISKLGIQTAGYREVTSADMLVEAVEALGTPSILKTVELGYDGKGQFVIQPDTDLRKLWADIGIGTGVLEAFVDYAKEISVVIARGADGQVAIYPAVENIHKSGILHQTIAPADVAEPVKQRAQEVAEAIAESLELVGVLAVELFVTKKGDVLVNEIAPRPHNSGHWTLDACVTCQFEQFIRAVCGLPLGSVEMLARAKMVNLIGSDALEWEKYLYEPMTKLHLYGKATARDGRKMGHVTRLEKLS